MPTNISRPQQIAEGVKGLLNTAAPGTFAMAFTAKRKHVPLIDLFEISRADAEHAGDDVWADLSPRDDKGQVDRTHLNAKGSDVVGRMVADALVHAVPELQRFFPAPVPEPVARPARSSGAAFVAR